MKKMVLMLLIMSFFLKLIRRAWSLFEVSTVKINEVMIVRRSITRSQAAATMA